MLRNLNDLTAWVLTDGKAGDELQCLGVTDALGLDAGDPAGQPARACRWLMPLGPVDPAGAAASARTRPIAPPFPDLLIASGRRAVPYLRRVKQASGGRTYTVFLKDPRTGASVADLIWVPEHDRLRGAERRRHPDLAAPDLAGAPGGRPRGAGPAPRRPARTRASPCSSAATAAITASRRTTPTRFVAATSPRSRRPAPA